MRKLIRLILALTLMLMILGCSGALKQAEIDPWLYNLAGGRAPEIDITGKWHDAKGNYVFGWGEGYFKQDQNKVSGAIGNYNVRGVVAGKQVFLVFLYGGDVYYTARLKVLEKGVLAGNYFDADDKRQENGYPTMLAKTAALESN